MLTLTIKFKKMALFKSSFLISKANSYYFTTLITTITIFIIIANSPPVASQSIGLTCIHTRDCTKPHMSCMGFKCNCDVGLSFDPLLDKCVKTVGRKCTVKYSQSQQSNVSTAAVVPDIEDDESNIPCASNAHCNSNTNICTCNEPDYSVVNGICYLNYGKSCTSKQPCNPHKYLKCGPIDETCICVDFGQIYDELAGSCVAKPGEYCDLEEYMMGKLECVQKANCVPSTNYNNREHQDYLQGRCQCSPGYINVSNEVCMPAYGMKCEIDTNASLSEPTKTCATNSNLICEPSTGKCTCASDSVLVPSSRAFTYDYIEVDEGDEDYGVGGDSSDYISSSDITVTGTCVRVKLVDEICIPTDICTPNSICKENAIPVHYRHHRKKFPTSSCQCLPGYLSTSGGACKAGHGYSCTSPSPSTSGKSNDECNEQLGLGCLNNTCQCFSNSTTFNGTRCVVVVGGNCTPPTSSTMSTTNTILLTCTNNAFCNEETNECECQESYFIDVEEKEPTNKCFPGIIDLPCNDHDNCLKSSGLTCVNKLCVCEVNARDKDAAYANYTGGSSSLVVVTHEFNISSKKCEEKIEIRSNGHNSLLTNENQYHGYVNSSIFNASYFPIIIIITITVAVLLLSSVLIILFLRLRKAH